ncbi:hypothetical protein SCUCBS95973_001672 [Sporothrix curviconia]|uniref:C6 zinc finger domain containing protein n=1 Tax=Sporothrix curviconia TaxID=1260050 RepID=A0ABP0B125_9PEZI
MLAFSARHLAFLAAEDSGSKSPPQQLQQQHAPRLSKTSSLPSHSSSISQASSPAPPPTASTPSTPQYPLPSSMPPLSFVSTPPYVCQSASSAARYQRQAVLLQTRAISLFNTAWRVSHGVIDRSNCVPMLLFSSVLGHHLFADSLSRRDDSLELFLEHYVQCSQLQRGVHDIAITTWPFLIASEFAPILQWSARFTSRRGRGNDCDQLLHLVDSASDGRLTTEDKDACRLAIRLLQVGFDVLFLPAPPKAEPKYAASSQLSGGSDNSNTMDETPDEMANTPSTSASTPSSSSSSPTETEPDDDDEKAEHAYRHKMIFLWALIMPKKFADLLSVKNPEALVILAYYSLLLHHGKHLWQVGDAGEYVMGLVTAYLGPSWDNWLEYPRQRMATDVVEAQSP